MSRIDKGGTKFRPMMPRSQKDRVSEKPRSSTTSRNKPLQPNAQLMPAEPSSSTRETAGMTLSGTDVIVPSTNTVNESSQQVEDGVIASSSDAQMESSLVEGKNNGQTLSNVPEAAIIRPVGNVLSMPSRSGARGSAISMPSGPRQVNSANGVPTAVQSRPTNLATDTPAIVPSVEPLIAPDINNPPIGPTTETSAQRKTVPRKSRKRKAPDDLRPQDQETDQAAAEPLAKKRRQTRSTSKPQAPKAAPKPKRTTRSTPSQPVQEDDGDQEVQEEPPTRTEEPEGIQESDEENVVRRPRRQRKARPRVDKPANSVPEESGPLDETTTTMKDLCNGMGMGRVSGRYLETFIESNEATKRKRGDNLRLKELTRRKELGLPIDDDEALALSARGRRSAALAQAASRVQPSQANGSNQTIIHEKNGEEDEEEDEYAGLAVTSRAPKVRYDANGNLVLDETELQFDRQAEADEELAARGPMEVIIETDRGKFTNHASYSKKPRVERWSKDETDIFYTGLRMFHTGFELIARTLPNRNRTMVRNKFKAEDRKNPEKITHYLSSSMRLPYDLEFLSRETGRDFSGPIPQIQDPALIKPAENAEETEKDDESVKLRLSTAPPSGGESDRGEGTSVNASTSGRGRPTTKHKGKRKSSKSSNPSRPPSVPPRSVSVATLTGSMVGSSNAVEREKDFGPRPPRIAIANVSQRPLNPDSGVQINRTTTSVTTTGGRNMLVLPGGGREFRRNE